MSKALAFEWRASLAQVPRLLRPIASVCGPSLEQMAEDGAVGEYLVTQFKSPQELRMTILADFFKVRSIRESCEGEFGLFLTQDRARMLSTVLTVMATTVDHASTGD